MVLPAGSGAFIPIPSKEMGIPAPFFKSGLFLTLSEPACLDKGSVFC